jgi:hypothetical protein
MPSKVTGFNETEHGGGSGTAKDLIDEMTEEAGAGFFFGFTGAIQVSLAFGAMNEVAFAFEDADDSEYAIVVGITGQSFLDVFNGSFSELPDDFHYFEFFVSEYFRRLPRHMAALRAR